MSTLLSIFILTSRFFLTILCVPFWLSCVKKFESVTHIWYKVSSNSKIVAISTTSEGKSALGAAENCVSGHFALLFYFYILHKELLKTHSKSSWPDNSM